MLRASALAHVLGELDQELRLYRALVALLEQQYRAATNVDDRALKQLCDALTRQIELLNGRRQVRDPNLLGVVALFNRDDRRTDSTECALQLRCRELKQLALMCKSLCVRNGELLASHYECLHHALHGEIHTYAPA